MGNVQTPDTFFTDVRLLSTDTAIDTTDTKTTESSIITPKLIPVLTYQLNNQGVV